MKKKITIISFILILVLLIILSFILSYFDGKKNNEKKEEVKELVLNYLKDKYNDEFEIKDFSVEKVPYEIDVVSDNGIESSNFYVLKMVSTRLVEFDAVYIEYLDEDIYLENKENDIMEPGIYDNYIYEYKTRTINSELREKIISIIDNVKDIDVSLTDIGNYYIENLLIRQTLDSEEEIVLYEKYHSFNKEVSNIDFYNTTKDITSGDLVIDIEVNDYITEDNISSFKKKVIKIVSYLQEAGYENYEINFILNKYQSANVTRYLVDDKEQIYLMFDYDSFSNEVDESKLNAYILDK